MGGTGRTSNYREISYDPLPSQKRFHDCDCRFKGFSGPIGSGKSQALCQEAIRLSYLNPGRTGTDWERRLIRCCGMRRRRRCSRFWMANRIPYEQNKAENTLVMQDTRIEDPVSAGGRVRAAARHEPGVVRAGRTDLHAGRSVAAAGRPAARSEGDAAVRFRGVDAEGFRLGLPQVHCANRRTGTRRCWREPFENRYLLDKMPDFYERLKDSYDEKFYQQEVLGEYLSLTAGGSTRRSTRDAHVRQLEVDPATCRCCGRWISTWTR